MVGNSTCSDDHTLSIPDLATLQNVTIATASLSCVGSAFIIITYLLPRQPKRTIGLRCIFHLSIADFLSSLTFVIDGSSGNAETHRPCNSQPTTLCSFCAASAQFFGLATVLWTGMIAFALHMSVLRRSQAWSMASQDPSKLGRNMAASTWGTSSVVLLLLSAAGALGSSGNWCWIRSQAWWAGKEARPACVLGSRAPGPPTATCLVSLILHAYPVGRAGLLFYYVPLLLVGGYSATVYSRTRTALLALHREASANAAAIGHSMSASAGAVAGLTSRLRAFLLVYGIIHIVQVANRLHGVLFPNSPSFMLYMLQAILSPMQGLGNAIAYGWNPRVRRVWRANCPTLCGCLPADEGADRPPHGVSGGVNGPREVLPEGGLAEGTPDAVYGLQPAVVHVDGNRA